MQKFLINKTNHRDINFTERAIHEIRCGRPVLLNDNNDSALCMSAEILDHDLLSDLRLFAQDFCLLLTSNRLNAIFTKKTLDKGTYRVEILGQYGLKDIAILVGLDVSAINLDENLYRIQESHSLDTIAMGIVKLAKLLPAVIIMDMKFDSSEEMKKWSELNDIIVLTKSTFERYSEDRNNVYEVCSSPLFLKDCKDSKIIIYRSYSGGPEHYAIVVGDPNYAEPLVRIHSSCYTGDLLASLSCDCRNQLHMAIAVMAKNGGGIILYLSQDGRGIGIVNKVRTYEMQIHYNLDTVDANRFFGFEDDERTFDIAVKMLNKLGIGKLRLLTNNPKKIRELEKYGLNIVGRVGISPECNKYNENYIKVKIGRLGHLS